MVFKEGTRKKLCRCIKIGRNWVVALNCFACHGKVKVLVKLNGFICITFLLVAGEEVKHDCNVSMEFGKG